MENTDTFNEAVREILLNWHNLSPGDVSIIKTAPRKPYATVATTVDSPHFYVWERFERLGWANREFPAIIPRSATIRPAFFKMTWLGSARIPEFLEFYKLLPETNAGVFYVPNLPLPDAEALNNALDAAAKMCPEGRVPDGMTLEATMKLKLLHASQVALTLAAFAFDAKRAVAQAVGLQNSSDTKAAQSVLRALHNRIRDKRVFDQANLPKPERSLYAIASVLNVGLGDELACWLDTPGTMSDATKWLTQHARVIEFFIEHVRSGSNGAH